MPWGVKLVSNGSLGFRVFFRGFGGLGFRV